MRNKHTSKRLERAKSRAAFVEEKLGTGIICKRCDATCATFADACTADLAEMCPGFITIETARDEFDRLAASGSSHDGSGFCPHEEAGKCQAAEVGKPKESSMRTDEEILNALSSRFAVDTTARTLPPQMASPPPAHDRPPKASASIGWFRRVKYQRGKDGQFKPSRGSGR